MINTTPYTIIRLCVGQMQENCYIVSDEISREAVIVDPGDDGQYIIEALQKINAQPVSIVATHGHFDHIMAACELQLAYNLPFLIHADDVFLLSQMNNSAQHFLGIPQVDPPPVVTKTLKDKDNIPLGNETLTVIHTPGHTPGSICLVVDKKSLLVGDTLFSGGGVGRTDFSYSSHDKLNDSVKKILAYPPDTRLYPGHGAETSVQEAASHLI